MIQKACGAPASFVCNCMKKNYLRGSYFDKLMSFSKGGETPTGGNAKLLGELLNLPEEKKLRELRKIVHGIFLLGRDNKLFQLTEARRGGPQYHFMYAFIILSENPRFLRWTARWFLRKYTKISRNNYMLWALFALVYPQMRSSYRPALVDVHEFASKTENSFIQEILDSAVACSQGLVSLDEHKATIRRYLLPSEPSISPVTPVELGLGGRNL